MSQLIFFTKKAIIISVKKGGASALADMKVLNKTGRMKMKKIKNHVLLILCTLLLCVGICVKTDAAIPTISKSKYIIPHFYHFSKC